MLKIPQTLSNLTLDPSDAIKFKTTPKTQLMLFYVCVWRIAQCMVSTNFIHSLAIKLPVTFLVFSLGESSVLPAAWHPSCAQRVRAEQISWICPFVQVGVRKHVVHSNYPQVTSNQQTHNLVSISSRIPRPHPRGHETTHNTHIDTSRAGPGVQWLRVLLQKVYRSVIWRFVFLSND